MKKKLRGRRRTIREHGPDPIDVHVGRRLRQARHLAGRSQIELASAVGVSFQAVQKYEQGDNRLSASRLFKAAQFLVCSVLFFFDGFEPDAAPTNGGAFSKQEVELIRALRQIESKLLRDRVSQLIGQISVMQSNAIRDA